MRTYGIVTIKRTTVALVALLVVTGSAGFVVSGTTAAQENEFPTRLRFLHAATDIDQVEVAINGVEELDEFDYSDVSDWIEVDPGVIRVTITADRPGINYILFDTTYPVVAGQDYNIIITDVLVIATPVDTAPLQGDSARVKIVQASVDTPPLDVAIAGGRTLLEDLRYGEESDDLAVPAGTNDIQLLTSDTGEVLLDLPDVAVEPGMVYEFVIFGTPGSDDTPLTMTPLVSESQQGGQATPVATPAAA